MREFEYKGRQYRLPEKDFRKLLAKLDTSQAYYDGDEYRIDNSCVCPGDIAQNSSCRICSLGPGNGNCISLLEAAAGMGELSCIFDFDVDFLTFEVKDKEEAFKFLNAARASFLELKRVR